ncbi:hypothetical protein PUN28_014328 [Cardiocondyla obscurior]
MEAEDDEEVNDSNESSDECRTDAWDTVGGGDGGGSDEGGGDEQLFQINRLQQLASSEKSFDRQMVGRIVMEMFRAAVNNKITLIVEEVMQHVHLIVDDSDALVRSDLVEQIPNVAIICHEAPHLFSDVLRDHLLDIVMKYLSDLDNQVRQMAQNALTTLIKRGLLDNDTIENVICPTVESLSYMVVDEHVRNSNVSLMCRLAPLIGSELTEKIFLTRYLDLCKDNDMMARKICATHFGEMCTVVGKDKLHSKLIPTFVDLCGDRVWNVRKACVEVMMPVSCCSTPEHRRLFLADILTKHLNDDSKWVRISAFQILGPFISTFAKQFAEVTYNKNGELVYTSNQDKSHSIRYSYEEIFPTKTVIKSQIADMDDNTKNQSFMPVKNMNKCARVWYSSEKTLFDEKTSPWKKTSCSSRMRMADIEADQETNSEEAMLYTALRKLVLKRDANEAEKYNPFLYYYIPPDIPLDDELLHAARQSAMNRNNSQNATETEQSSTEENSSSCSSEIPIPVMKDSSSEDDSGINEELSLDKFGEEKKEITCDDEIACNNEMLHTHSVHFFDSEHFYIDYIDTDSITFVDKNEEFCKSTDEPYNEQTIVPQKLIDYYVSMAEPSQPAQFLDSCAEISHYCAFSFPAVAFTLGRENWHCLKKAYQSLSSAKHWKVRRTLASSIHEIAMILGEELTATDLVPIYDGFIKDLDEVRIGVLKHLATFLKILKPADRCQYLPRLSDFLATDNEWNWRFREELATQLLEIVRLFSPSDVAQCIAPLSFQLLIDKVAAVRTIALELITEIMFYLSTEDALVTSLIHELRETLVLDAKKWIHRQTYALVCTHLIRNNAITTDKFSKEMLPCLISLSCDRVPNVRLAVARTLATDVISLDSLDMETVEEVERILTKMRVDADRDVRMLAGGEEQQIDILGYCSSDENNQIEQPRNILF